MNRQTTQILELGIIFAVVVAFADVFLIQLPVLDWLALAVAFFFVAAVILDSVARLVPSEKRKLQSTREIDDELQYLADVIDRAINRHEHESLQLLSEKLRSIALGTVAARRKLSKKEILELARNDPSSLLAIVKDEQIVRLLLGNAQMPEVADRHQVEELLSKIEDWYR